MFRPRNASDVHTSLAIAGLIPGIGEFADGADAVLYLIEGDTSNALLSAAAMLPGVGAAAGAAKLARLSDEVTQTAATAGSRLGWSTGQDINALTKAGDAPAWSTVRGRFWKNEAAKPQIDNWSAANLDRMRRGLAPQRYNRDKGGLESMELSHEPIPYRDGGTNVVPRWPQDHANVDPFRFPGY